MKLSAELSTSSRIRQMLMCPMPKSTEMNKPKPQKESSPNPTWAICPPLLPLLHLPKVLLPPQHLRKMSPIFPKQAMTIPYQPPRVYHQDLRHKTNRPCTPITQPPMISAPTIKFLRRNPMPNLHMRPNPVTP